MTKTVLLMATLAIFASFPAGAAVTVLDAPSCSQWNPKDATYRIWIEAYLSGIAIEKNDDFLAKVSLDRIASWVSNYCKVNPKGEVAVAGVELSLELTKRHQSAPR